MAKQADTSKRLLAINSAASVASKIVNLIVQLWVVRYLLNTIAAEEFQLWPIVSGLSMFLPIFNSILTAGLGRYVVEAYAREDHARITQITSTMALFCFGGAFVLGGIVLLLAWRAGALLDVPADRVWLVQLMILISLGSTPISLAMGPFQVGLYARQKFVVQGLLDTFASFLRAGLLFGLLLGVSSSVLWIPVAYTGAGMTQQVLRLIISRRLLPSLRFRPGSVCLGRAREITGFGVWASVGRFSMAIRDAADPIILNKLAGAVAVNSFHVGLMIDRNARMILSWMVIPFVPMLTTMHAREESARLRNAFVRATRIILWLALLPTMPLVVFRNELAAVYLGDALATYPETPVLMALVLLTYPAWYSIEVLRMVALARADVRPIALRGLGTQVFGLALAIVLVGPVGMGAMGAALAALASRGIVLPVLFLPLVPKLTGMARRRFIAGAVVPGVGPAVVVGSAAELVRAFVLPEGPAWWVSALVVATLIQIAGIGLMLSPADRQDLRRIVQRVPWARRHDRR